MIKNCFISVAVLFFIVACGGGGGGSSAGPTPTANSQISIANPPAIYGALASVSSQDANAKKTQPDLSSSGVPYYIPVTNTSTTIVSVVSLVVERNPGVWSAAISQKCANGISMDSCDLIVTFDANAVSSTPQLTTTLMVSFSDGTIRHIPLTGQIVASDTIVMQASKQIITNSSGKAYGVISAFNNTPVAMLVDEDNISTDNGDKWTFTVNCDGNRSKVINPGSSCSIGFVSNSTVFSSTTVQIHVPLLDQNGTNPLQYFIKNLSSPQTINVPTVVAPALTESAPYVAYLGDAVYIKEQNTVPLSLLNLGTGNLQGIIIDGLPKSIAQTNDCRNVAPNALCNVVLTVIGAPVPPITILSIHAANEISSNIQQVHLMGQAMALSFWSVDFGKVFGGASVQQDIIIRNLGTTALNYHIGTIDNHNFTVDAGNCTSDSLAKFDFCTFHVVYNAPHETLQDSASLTISSSTAGESAQTITLAANVIGQALSVSPLALDFGSVFSRASAQKSVVISNLGASSLSYQIGTVANPKFTVDPGNCSSGTLAGLESCTFNVIYTASAVTESDTASLVVSSAPSNTGFPQTISLTARSIYAPEWTNIINSVSYTDSGSIVSALIANMNGTSAITIGNFANHVWQLSADGVTWVKKFNNYTNYYNQPITAFGFATSTTFGAGYVDGDVQLCGVSPSNCNQIFPPQPPFSVTSQTRVASSTGMVGYASANGRDGKLISNIGDMPIIVSGVGVGKLAIDGPFGNATHLYVPLSDGRIVEVTSPWVEITNDITPNNFAESEYATVMFYDLRTNTLFAGTNLANVYMSNKPIAKTNWIKLTTTPISGTSYISSIATNAAGDIFAGLSTYGDKTVGGGLYILLYGSPNFIPADPTYNDPSAVTNIVFDSRLTGHIYVGTYAGNVWQR